jgi:hypothetical protein
MNAGTDMTQRDRNALIAAAIILVVIAGLAFMMPTIMLWLAQFSPYAAGAFGLLFLFAFFIIFWLRARSQRQD